ncbi:MAG: DUF4293 domain-containing protein [Bacteroidales bacterium]|nr:DUF4293 domain-containing protein [Bacteroidales bacterium]
MIQRIQSLYLLLVVVFSILLPSGNILTFSDAENNILYLKYNGLVTTGSYTPDFPRQVLNLFIALNILLALMSLISIFLYRNRKRQGKMVLAAVILALSIIATESVLVYSLVSNAGLRLIPGAGMILPLIMTVLALLARRGILKDEKLVSSYERLR